MAATTSRSDALSSYRASLTSAIRAVLTANRDGVPLRRFVDEYRSLVFDVIDHRRLGYGSLLELLRWETNLRVWLYVVVEHAGAVHCKFVMSKDIKIPREFQF